MAGFAVEGSGGTYLVMRDGVTVGGPYANKWWAEDACDALDTPPAYVNAPASLAAR